MWIKIGISVLVAILSALMYRAGGMGKEVTAKPTWMPQSLRHSWCRDWICPAFALITLLMFFQPNVWWGWLLAIPVYGLMGGAFSTYWDWAFGGNDNYYAHGFFVGLSIFPFCFVGLAWWIVAIQTILISVSMGLWSAKTDKDFVEEEGRGFFSSIFRI